MTGLTLGHSNLLFSFTVLIVPLKFIPIDCDQTQSLCSPTAHEPGQSSSILTIWPSIVYSIMSWSSISICTIVYLLFLWRRKFAPSHLHSVVASLYMSYSILSGSCPGIGLGISVISILLSSTTNTEELPVIPIPYPMGRALSHFPQISS